MNAYKFMKKQCEAKSIKLLNFNYLYNKFLGILYLKNITFKSLLGLKEDNLVSENKREQEFYSTFKLIIEI